MTSAHVNKLLFMFINWLDVTSTSGFSSKAFADEIFSSIFVVEIEGDCCNDKLLCNKRLSSAQFRKKYDARACSTSHERNLEVNN